MIIQFHYEPCHFRNTKGTYQFISFLEEMLLMIEIRRASLDAFWSREPGTFRGYLTMLINLIVTASEYFGLDY